MGPDRPSPRASSNSLKSKPAVRLEDSVDPGASATAFMTRSARLIQIFFENVFGKAVDF